MKKLYLEAQIRMNIHLYWMWVILLLFCMQRLNGGESIDVANAAILVHQKDQKPREGIIIEFVENGKIRLDDGTELSSLQELQFFLHSAAAQDLAPRLILRNSRKGSVP